VKSSSFLNKLIAMGSTAPVGIQIQYGVDQNLSSKGNVLYPKTTNRPNGAINTDGSFTDTISGLTIEKDYYFNYKSDFITLLTANQTFSTKTQRSTTTPTVVITKTPTNVTLKGSNFTSEKGKVIKITITNETTKTAFPEESKTVDQNGSFIYTKSGLTTGPYSFKIYSSTSTTTAIKSGTFTIDTTSGGSTTDPKVTIIQSIGPPTPSATFNGENFIGTSSASINFMNSSLFCSNISSKYFLYLLTAILLNYIPENTKKNTLEIK